MKYSKYLLAFIRLLIIGASLDAKELRKDISRTFEISSKGTIEISNSYGNVFIIESDDDKVHFDIEIIAKGKKEDQLKEAIERIEIDFSSSESHISAETEQNFKTKWSWGRRTVSFKVVYNIRVPNGLDIEVGNKFGNVDIRSTMDDLYVELKYGNLNLAPITGNAEIRLGHGNGYIQDVEGNLDLDLDYVGSFNIGTIKKTFDFDCAFSHCDILAISSGNIKSKYSHINIESANKLEIDSGFDQYKITTVKEIQIDGKYDKYEIGMSDNFEIDTKFSHIQINYLSTRGEFDTEYGSVRIKNLHQDFKQLEIESEFTGYGIGLRGGAKISVASKYTDVDVPDDTEISFRDRDGSSLSLKAHYKDPNAGSLIAEMRYGGLKLRGN